MKIVAERETLRFGWNVTVMVQLALGAKPVPPIGQSLVCGKRAGFGPPTVMLVNTSGTVPVFVTVTLCGVLGVLIGTLSKAREFVERATPGLTDEPVRATVPVTAGAATATRSVADRLRLLFGVKVTFTVQLPPAANPVPPMGQLWVMPKRKGFAPPRVMPVILIGALPALDTVTG